MLKEHEVAYGFDTQVNGKFDDVRTKVVDALKTEGFGVLTEIDVSATLKAKLGKDMARYSILGACNPTLANQAITAEPQIGLLLPCNVVLQEQPDGKIQVSFMDPVSVLALVNNAQVTELGWQVRTKLEKVRDSLG
ncbi:MAG: DUF302 domain-containing protein [Gammaproteobacteria bacterium]|nr:DUF302 domain-containing protein [Gammaproteobacteria bacterium]